MSVDARTEADLAFIPTAEIGRLRSRSLLVGGAGIILSIIGFVVRGDAFWQSYLVAYFFWIGLTIGSMAVLMVQYLSGGAWGIVARRVFEAGTQDAAGDGGALHPDRPEHAEALQLGAARGRGRSGRGQPKALYLNVPFFIGRAVIYFVIWGVLIYLLNKWSREQDENPQMLPGPQDRRFRLLAGPGLVLYVLTITFMSIDWVMSLDPALVLDDLRRHHARRAGARRRWPSR